MEHVVIAAVSLVVFLVNIPLVRGMRRRTSLRPDDPHYVSIARARAMVWIWVIGIALSGGMLIAAVLMRW